jgi:hypothetical protein
MKNYKRVSLTNLILSGGGGSLNFLRRWQVKIDHFAAHKPSSWLSSANRVGTANYMTNGSIRTRGQVSSLRGPYNHGPDLSPRTKAITTP